MNLPTLTFRRAGWVIVVALSLYLLFYVGVLTKAYWGIGGAPPDGKSAGSLSFVWQDNAEYCAGIVETPKATWLIGYVRDSTPGEYTKSLPRQPFVIDSLLTGYDRKNDITRFADSLSGNSRPTTFISKLSAEGKFELVATVGGIACLQSSPDGASVFLLTDMNLPEGDKGKNASIDLDQTAVFRSDDQGQNWHWLRDGLFPQAEYSAWAMKLGFYGPQGMWVFGGQTMSQSIDIDHPKKNIEGVIYHSSDLGRTVKTITVPPDMVVPTNDSDDIKRFVFQTSDDRAYAWTSQWKTENGVCTSAVLELRLHDGRWQAGEMRRDADVCIEDVKQSSDGRVLAAVVAPGTYHPALAEWDAASLHWKVGSDFPNLFHPLSGDTSMHRFFVGKQLVVIDIESRHAVPRWIYWWDNVNVYAKATYYSLDGGHSWRPSNLSDFEIAGVGQITDRLFGHQYDHRRHMQHDLTLQAFDLSH